jgi:transcriptional regulator with XRE-family HTH domain
MMGNLPDIAILKNAFGHILLEERNKHGLTQAELAEKSGLTRQCISRIESGQGSPTLLSFLSIAVALNMSITDFIYSLAKKAKSYEFDD